MDIEILTVALMVSLALTKIFEVLFAMFWPLLGWDPKWKVIPAFVLGTALGLATGLNAFPMFEVAWVGSLVTSCVMGAGPGLIYDLLDRG